MTRIAIVGLAFLAGACTIDGPEPGSVGVLAEMERQERILQQEAERQRLCSMLDRDSDRYARDCAPAGAGDR